MPEASEPRESGEKSRRVSERVPSFPFESIAEADTEHGEENQDQAPTRLHEGNSRKATLRHVP